MNLALITFYVTIDSDSVRSYMPPVPVMLPASSWARKGMRAPKLPCHVTERAADCGGYVATKYWGAYRYTPEQYVEWLMSWQPQWAATMDFCCEDEITAGRPGLVRQRQERTTEMAWLFWQEYKKVPWAWVPTIQGWEIEDYCWHARQLRPLIEDMRLYYKNNPFWRVGIGTLCRRVSVSLILEIVTSIARELPGIPLHLWGVKLAVLQSPIALPQTVVSVDSAAWNGFFGRNIENRRHSKLSQREYAYLVSLPRYLQKVKAATCAPKQLSLYFGT